MAKYPSALATLIATLKKLPGVGTKTAERFAFHLLDWSKSEIDQLAGCCKLIKEKISHCQNCHCLQELNECCSFCNDALRDSHFLCVIASPKDVYAIEETQSYRGLYHVLGGLLSPLEGISPQQLRIPSLQDKIARGSIKEVILALDSTIEGDTTALYLKELLSPYVHISRLAFGLPIGSSLDFVDGTTLTRALTGRHSF